MTSTPGFHDFAATPDPGFGGAVLSGDAPEFQRFIAGSRPIPLDGLDWDAIPHHPLSADVIRINAVTLARGNALVALEPQGLHRKEGFG